MEVVRSISRESEKRFGTPSLLPAKTQPQLSPPLWKTRIEADLFEFSESVQLAEALELTSERSTPVDMWNENGFLEDIGVHGWADIEPEAALPIPHPHAHAHSHSHALAHPHPRITAARTPSGRNVDESSQVRTPTRYTETEVKALVHAKLRLQMLNSFGENSSKSEENCLRNLYLHYLQLLDRTGYESYPPREGSALLRKFKSLKSKGTQLVEYFDGTLDNGLWLHMKKLITEPVRLAKRKSDDTDRSSGSKRSRGNGSSNIDSKKSQFDRKHGRDGDVL